MERKRERESVKEREEEKDGDQERGRVRGTERETGGERENRRERERERQRERERGRRVGVVKRLVSLHCFSTVQSLPSTFAQTITSTICLSQTCVWGGVSVCV